MTQFHNNRRNRSVRRCVCWCFFLCKQPGSGPPLRSPLSHRCVMEKGCVCVCVCYSGGRNPFDWSSGLGRPHLILRQELQRRQEQLLATLWKCHQAKGHYKTDCFMNPLLYAQTHNHANTRIHPHAHIHTMKMAIRGMPTWGKMLWATKGEERGT